MKTRNDAIIKSENYRRNMEDSTGLKGYVEIYEDDINLIGKSNLILWAAREIVLEKLFYKERVVGDNNLNLGIYWFSVGTGGADPADKMEPIAPIADQTALTTEIFLDAGNPNYAQGGLKKGFDSHEWQQDNLNGNRYLISKLKMVIDTTDANGNDINEAMLWFSNSDDPSNATIFKPFSKVTFSSYRKTSKRKLTLVWYLYV